MANLLGASYGITGGVSHWVAHRCGLAWVSLRAIIFLAWSQAEGHLPAESPDFSGFQAIEDNMGVGQTSGNTKMGYPGKKKRELKYAVHILVVFLDPYPCGISL